MLFNKQAMPANWTFVMKTIPTLSVVALALGLVAAKSHSDSLHAPMVTSTPVHHSAGATTPMPDFFGSMLVVR